MPDYRDYGTFVTEGAVAPSVLVNTERHTQVYQATHDEHGNRLPYMYRSFISFTYGGKCIEDFNLIAITDGDAINRNLSANFEDIVTAPATANGQFYWGTHYQNNTLNLTLATDGINQKQLDEFKLWFQPGVERELILSENPFRGIMARIGAVSTMEMLPFEEKIKIKVAGNEYTTSITNYKGKIHLTFTMDDPFWYALYNVLDYEVDGMSSRGVWYGADGQPVQLLGCPDALKVVYEDRIPILDMFDYVIDNKKVDDNVSRGDGNYKNSSSNTDIYAGSTISGDGDTTDTSLRAHVSGYRNGMDYTGYVGLYMNTMPEGGMFPTFGPGKSNKKYFYYAGTAPAFPIIQFSIEVGANAFNNGNDYFNIFNNEYTSSDANGATYSSIIAEGLEKHILKLTTPSLFTAYNQAVAILKTIFYEPLELEDALRDGVHHKIIRDKAIQFKTISTLKSVLTSIGTFSFMINCNTGTAKMTYTYNGEKYEENVGNMVVSNYMKIIERNRLNDDGWVDYWDNDKEYSHILYHDINTTLRNVGFLFRYRYL